MDRNIGLGGIGLTEAVGGLDFQLVASSSSNMMEQMGEFMVSAIITTMSWSISFQKVVGGNGLADVGEGLQLKGFAPGSS